MDISCGWAWQTCTLLLAAGNDRYIGPQARVGFHRSSGAWTKPGSEWSASDFQMADYYLARGSSQEFIARALDTPPADLWLPDPSCWWRRAMPASCGMNAKPGTESSWGFLASGNQRLHSLPG